MKRQLLTGFGIAVLCFGFAGCKKKVAMARPTPPPAPVAQTAPPAPRTTTPQPARTPEVAAAPQSRMPDAATRARIQELLDKIQDAYFDYDKHSLRPDAEAALKSNVQTLSEIIRQYPDFRLTVEGYADERGSDEYNLGLGEARAKKAKDYMVSLGLPEKQLKTLSYGKEKPVCTQSDEACWQKNRRAHITQAQ